MPNLFVMAGPSGAGKTTSSRLILTGARRVFRRLKSGGRSLRLLVLKKEGWMRFEMQNSGRLPRVEKPLAGVVRVRSHRF